MDRHPGRLGVPALKKLAPYQPGKPIAELERELGIANIVKLASNENHWGPSPKALQALHAALPDIWLYPDGSCHELKTALSTHLGLSEDHLTLGNGSNDLLVLLAEAFLGPGTNAVYSQYGFAYYPLVTLATGAEPREVPALPVGSAMPLGHDLEAMCRAVDANTRLVFIANPNNPTGTWVDPEELLAFIDGLPNTTLVVLDEAYLEFGRLMGAQDAVRWVSERPNLVLLRTFSKAYALAGLRVGYGISHPEVTAALNKLRPAFNVNSLAQVAAVAALADQQHLQSAVTQSVAEVRRLEAGLAKLGLTTIPTAANFVLTHFGARAPRIYERLLQAGLIVRPVGSYGLPEYLRLSVGKPADNERLLAALARCLQ
jgi:histidinol-phosphate aminotransferase